MEEVLKGLAKQVDDHEDAIVSGIVTEVVQLHDTRCVQTQLRMPWNSWYSLISYCN